jgi:chemotaxis protein CheD
MIENPAERRIYLYPGEFVTLREAFSVTTVLGSCVAACLWDPVRRFGGMTHFILPHHVGNGVSSPRFGNVAIRLVLDGLRELGCRRGDLEAKLFGGASVQGAASGDALTLGARNVVAAREALEQAGVPVVAEDVGGGRGRKIVFDSAEGTVWMKRLGES